MRILIIGAGIGGLTCAAMLVRAGHDVVVTERRPTIRGDGAGIMLHSRAVDILEECGATLRDRGLPLRTMSITTPDGRSRGAVRDRWAFARAELMAQLVLAASKADVRCGTRAGAIRAERGAVSCRLGDEVEQFDLVVGADGLSSTTRTDMSPRARLRHSGQTSWRGIVEGESGTHGTEMWNGRERVGVVPLSGGRTYVYLVADQREASRVPRPAALPRREQKALDALLALDPSLLLCHDLRELERPEWGSRRIALLGDAAHAITPNLGLGAALAVDDAVALVAAVTRTSDFRGYARRRQMPVRLTQLASRSLGRVAHSPTPAAMALRRLAGIEFPEPDRRNR